METSNNQNQNEFENSINARPITESEKSYRDGYYQGKREATPLPIETTIKERDNSTGLLIGFMLALLATLGLVALFVFNGNNQPTTVPDNSTINENVKPEAVEPVDQETTIIERTIEKTQEVVPVPQIQPINPNPIQSESQPAEDSINVPATTSETPGDEMNTTPETTEKELKSSEPDSTLNPELNQDETQVEPKP